RLECEHRGTHLALAHRKRCGVHADRRSGLDGWVPCPRLNPSLGQGWAALIWKRVFPLARFVTNSQEIHSSCLSSGFTMTLKRVRYGFVTMSIGGKTRILAKITHRTMRRLDKPVQ